MSNWNLCNVIVAFIVQTVDVVLLEEPSIQLVELTTVLAQPAVHIIRCAKVQELRLTTRTAFLTAALVLTHLQNGESGNKSVILMEL